MSRTHGSGTVMGVMIDRYLPSSYNRISISEHVAIVKQNIEGNRNVVRRVK